ncbi:MAG TPA: glycosylasparaginase [Lachnospiraceae bacterium]|nr:glycosylasparaginase [Lachnospiraceae bacterium]
MKTTDQWNFIATWKMSLEGVRRASRVLGEGQSLERAVVEAVKTVEDEVAYCSVGYGGLPNRNGEVELDAAYMDGDTLKAGGVMAVRDIKNPVEVACRLSKYERNCFLAGEGAMTFARRHRFALRNMLTPEAAERFKTAKIEKDLLERQEAYDGHDTVCVIGRDAGGSMACGVSTSGLFLKHPGRVGDSPIIGSGFYADSGVGAAAATGVGEDIMRGCLSYAVVGRMACGCPVQEACENVLADHTAKLRRIGRSCGSMSVIAMDREGRVGAATNLELFPFAVGNMAGECHTVAAKQTDGRIEIFEPDEEEWKKYEVD